MQMRKAGGDPSVEYMRKAGGDPSVEYMRKAGGNSNGITTGGTTKQDAASPKLW